MRSARGTALVALCLSAGAAWSAPVTFNTALPVHEGGVVLREQPVFMKRADDPTPARRDMEVTGLASVLGYGVSRDFALFGMLRYVDKRLEMRMEGQGITRSEAGVGDLTLLCRYNRNRHRRRRGVRLRRPQRAHPGVRPGWALQAPIRLARRGAGATRAPHEPRDPRR